MVDTVAESFEIICYKTVHYRVCLELFFLLYVNEVQGTVSVLSHLRTPGMEHNGSPPPKPLSLTCSIQVTSSQPIFFVPFHVLQYNAFCVSAPIATC
jgi:hypothetical protein